MVTKVHRDALASEIASVGKLLEGVNAEDVLSTLSLRKRLEVLQAELEASLGELATAADVALIFDGGPVRGSSAIDADFAGKALQDYQDLVTKHVALSKFGGLAERGPVQHDAKAEARMNITALVHGSFGFVLQEDHADEPQFLVSPTRQAVEEVSNLLADATASDAARFEARLDEVDVRVFRALRRFVINLHKASSTLRIAEQEREVNLDLASVGRAYERLMESEVAVSDETVSGELLGLVPIQRRFEFRREDGEIIQGRVSPHLSEDYLERLEHEGVVAGSRWQAVIETKEVQHPDRRHVTTTKTLIDLVPLARA